jgi:hypothetical protein
MPVSIWLGLEDCLQAINECWPCSVLDAGIGFGLFGHLLRQYFDLWEGRIQRAEWRIRIDGIEIDARSNQPHARYLYNDVFVGDIRELVPVHASRSPYDVILFGDVLEHLPKDNAGRLLRKSIALAMKRVIVRIPLGDGWRKQGREEPDHHRSTWSLEDFSGLAATIRQYHYVGNPYALVAIHAPASRGLTLEKTDRGLLQIEKRVRRLFRQRGDA